MSRFHADTDSLAGPPPEVLAEIDAAWERAQELFNDEELELHFEVDRRFGLIKGFSTYGDRMPRVAGAPQNERPGWMAVDEALAWLQTNDAARFLLWVHLFEPHAPYGRPGDGRPASARYDDEVAEADRQTGRLIEGHLMQGLIWSEGYTLLPAMAASPPDGVKVPIAVPVTSKSIFGA